MTGTLSTHRAVSHTARLYGHPGENGRGIALVDLLLCRGLGGCRLLAPHVLDEPEGFFHALPQEETIACPGFTVVGEQGGFDDFTGFEAALHMGGLASFGLNSTSRTRDNYLALEGWILR